MKARLAEFQELSKISAIPSLLEVICRATGLGVAVIAQVTDTSWTACAVRDEAGFGLSVGDELPAEVTPCFEVKEREQPVVINDLAADPAHASNPVLARGRFQSYISAPVLLGDGRFFGTLCALGVRPARLDTPEIIGMFQLFAGLVADQINSADSLEASASSLRTAASRLDISETGRQNAEAELATSAADLMESNSRLAISDAALLDAKATAELREQFVAILGHDLRNPIASILSGVGLLRRANLDDRNRHIAEMMGRSAERMNELVRNMLDFTRTQLGGGIPLIRQEAELKPVLRHVISELQAKNPGQLITAELELPRPVNCDPDRIGQMLSNLLGNAVTHGAADQPVVVRAGVMQGTFELSVANGGKPIPAEAMASLFKPYVRGRKENVEGLGLGLHIAAGIAHAHGGTLTATSTPAETRFTFKMPTND